MPTEYTIQQQEQQIPQLAKIALHEAAHSALASGYQVFEAQHNHLIEIVDGQMYVRQSVPASVAVECGQVIRRSK